MMKTFTEWIQSRGQGQLNEDFGGMCGCIISPKPMFLGSPLRELLGDEAYDEMMNKGKDETKKAKAEDEKENEDGEGDKPCTING